MYSNIYFTLKLFLCMLKVVVRNNIIQKSYQIEFMNWNRKHTNCFVVS